MISTRYDNFYTAIDVISTVSPKMLAELTLRVYRHPVHLPELVASTADGLASLETLLTSNPRHFQSLWSVAIVFEHDPPVVRDVSAEKKLRQQLPRLDTWLGRSLQITVCKRAQLGERTLTHAASLDDLLVHRR